MHLPQIAREPLIFKRGFEPTCSWSWMLNSLKNLFSVDLQPITVGYTSLFHMQHDTIPAFRAVSENRKQMLNRAWCCVLCFLCDKSWNYHLWRSFKVLSMSQEKKATLLFILPVVCILSHEFAGKRSAWFCTCGVSTRKLKFNKKIFTVKPNHYATLPCFTFMVRFLFMKYLIWACIQNVLSSHRKLRTECRRDWNLRKWWHKKIT